MANGKQKDKLKQKGGEVKKKPLTYKEKKEYDTLWDDIRKRYETLRDNFNTHYDVSDSEQEGMKEMQDNYFLTSENPIHYFPTDFIEAKEDNWPGYMNRRNFNYLKYQESILDRFQNNYKDLDLEDLNNIRELSDKDFSNIFGKLKSFRNVSSTIGIHKNDLDSIAKYEPELYKDYHLNLAKPFLTKNNKMQKKQKGGKVTSKVKGSLGQQVGNLSNAPHVKDPLAYAQDLYTHFNKKPDKYKMSGRAYDLTPEAYKKYPNLSYVKDLPVQPKRYTTGTDLQSGEEFAYPAYDLEEIQSYSLGGILGDTASMAGIGSAFGPIGTAIGGGLGLVKGLIGHSKEKKEEERLEGMQQNANLERIRGMQTSQSVNNPYAATFPYGGMMPYSLAELEKEEVMQAPDGDMSMVDGPTHAQGGVPVRAEEGTRVFSDRLKIEGKTFAEMAEKIGKKKAKAEETIEDNKSTDIAKSTAEKNLVNYQKQLDELFMQQEAMKPQSEQGEEYDLGGIIGAAGEWLGKNSDKITSGLEIAGQLAPIGYNLYQGMQPEQELNASEFYNPQANQAMSLMSDRRFNVDPTLRANEGAYRTALSNIKSASGGNRGTLLANTGGAMRGMQSANAQAYAQKQNMDNQYMAEEAQMRAGLGSERAQTDFMVSDLNTRNEAARRAFLGQAAGQLGQFSQAQAVNRGMRERDEMLMPLMQDYLGMLGDKGGSQNNLNFQTPGLDWSPSDMSLNPYNSAGGYGSALTRPKKFKFGTSYKGRE